MAAPNQLPHQLPRATEIPSRDVRYVVNASIVGSIYDRESLTIFGAGASFRMPISLFQVLVAFAEPTTAQQAFAALDTDVELPEFHDIVDDLIARKLLTPCALDDRAPGLQDVLAPRIVAPDALDHLATSLRAGHAIVVPNALPETLAESAYRDLQSSTQWRVTEGAHDFFHYRNCFIPQLADQSPALAECNRIFKSAATRRFIGELTGEDCTGEASVAAAWYRANEYALPHDDSTSAEPRSVAFIWYLTKQWKPEWGGTLFWCPTGQFIMPTFNALVLFRVMPTNIHCVCPVASAADQKRLTINGFWHRAQRSPAASPPITNDLVSPRVDGSPAVDQASTTPFLVL